MKVLLSWLSDFAPIEGDPVELGEHLSDLGLAVEEMRVVGKGLDGVLVARVLGLRPHPDADRVQLVDVDAGDGAARQVVCGAFNMQAGDLVPLADIGTRLANGMEIQRRKVRGETSNGMLCAPDEIGLGDDHSGILILDPTLEVGAPLADALDVRADVLYDLEVNPNRPDAMSVAGVARDLAARLGVPFAIPEPQVDETATRAPNLVSVEIVDPDLCGRFVARVLENVTIGTSPPWLASRLVALGMRPINSVVDISNYVMLELGQPNHTFDLACVPDGHLRVRRARGGETLVTLDGEERNLVAGDGLITDNRDTPISLAGVMGGATTEISESTTAVLLEMAWWDPPSIARTARRLGLRSEASARFERGTDPQVIELAMRRFAELAAANGVTLAAGVVDEAGALPTPARVRVRPPRVNHVLGTDLSAERMKALLEPIGFNVKPAGDDFDVDVPSYRPDTSTEIDVIEEIARHAGYSSIERTVPVSLRVGQLTPLQHDRRLVRATLVGAGCAEAMPLPFLAPEDTAAAGLPPDAIGITNPMVDQENTLRTSLRPGLLKTLAYNASHRRFGLWLFELGHVFGPKAASELPDEREQVGVILGGSEAPAAVDVWHLVRGALGVADAELAASDELPGMHPTRSARIQVAGGDVGVVGEIDPAVLDAFRLSERVAWLELDLTALLALPHGERQYRQVSRYPSSDIDLAFVVDDAVPAAAVEGTLRSAAGDALASLSLFDVYRGEQLGDSKRSLAYGIRLQSSDHTLTDDEVARVRAQIIDAVEQAHPAKLRT